MMTDTRHHRQLNSHPRGLLIAAPQSGSGKTLITLALLRALKLAGLNVRAAKAGPDYIDPAFHQIASGAPSVNLDPWAMGARRCRDLANQQVGDGAHLLVEAMMGLYDGAADGSGSAAHLAANLDFPVVLIVDAAKQSHSIGALVRGFRDHDKGIKIAGVILNKVASERHENMLRQSLLRIEMPVIGAVRRDPALELPERHLGLVQAGEISVIEDFVADAAAIIAKQCDLQMLTDCFGQMNSGQIATGGQVRVPGQNIAIARDQAFSFIYPHLLSDWQGQGAQISFFSPLADQGPDEDADAVYLPGGYPELHAAKISAADNFAHLMTKARDRGALIYGECGGYMVLGERLVDGEGVAHPMLGFLQLETSFEKPKLHLGYRRLTARGDFFAGQNITAHEFHYTSILRQNGEALFEASDALGEKLGQHGLRDGNVMGSYMHLIDAGTGLDA